MARRSAAESAGRERGKKRRTASRAVRAFCRLRRPVSVTPEVRAISRKVKANSRSAMMNSAQARLQLPACGVSSMPPAIAFGASSWSKMRWAISSSVSNESSGRTAQLRNWRASRVGTKSPCARFSKTRRANSALDDIEAQPNLCGAPIISCLFVQARRKIGASAGSSRSGCAECAVDGGVRGQPGSGVGGRVLPGFIHHPASLAAAPSGQLTCEFNRTTHILATRQGRPCLRGANLGVEFRNSGQARKKGASRTLEEPT
jgi:hypothetical protein